MSKKQNFQIIMLSIFEGLKNNIENLNKEMVTEKLRSRFLELKRTVPKGKALE